MMRDKKRLYRWLFSLSGLLLLCLGGSFFYVNNLSANPTPEGLAGLESTASVTVTQDPWLIFEPTQTPPTTGFIFYPGGLVDEAAYAPLAHEIASHGFLVVIVPMPFDLAVFSPNQAQEVIIAYPQIKTWAIGGHSLGGAMAAQFTDENPEQIAGLVLWASYPAEASSLSDRTLPVTAIFGSEDGLLSAGDRDYARQVLPANSQVILIEGGNHAQFGWYGLQEGDNPATISSQVQQEQTISATLRLLDKLVK